MVRRISGKGFVIVTVLAMALSPFWAGQAGAQRYTPADTDGLIARLGSTVYDGSIARHLERMRQNLLAG